MRAGKGAGAIALGILALFTTGCTPSPATAELTVTSESDSYSVALDDLTCRSSSVNVAISSAAVTDADKPVFLATAPTEDRNAYAVTVWLDGFWFTSDEKFDATASPIVFDALPGVIAASPDGSYPAPGGVAATLSGTITCP